MKWEKGRRGGNIEDRRGMHRVDSLLARSPTFMREAGPAFVRPDRRYGESRVSEILRERPRAPRFNKGGFVAKPKAQKGGPNYVKPYYHGHDEGTPPSKPRGKFAAGGLVGDGCVIRGKTKGKNC
jgi:hypothetical protein